MVAGGVLCLALGAILYWVVEVDLPYVDDNALGAILLVAGVVALAGAVLVRSPYGNRGVGNGLGLILAGAVVRWAVDINLPRLDDDALAVILMVAGALLVAASALVTAEQAQAGVGAAVGLMALGALVFWALELDLRYVDDQALGTILMVVGGIGAVATVLAQVRSSRRLRVRADDRLAGRAVR